MTDTKATTKPKSKPKASTMPKTTTTTTPTPTVDKAAQSSNGNGAKKATATSTTTTNNTNKTTTTPSKKSSSASSSGTFMYGFIWLAIAAYIAYRLLWWAYKIRLQAIEAYGAVIHEFDPYFNYRATEYLYQHGWRKFFTWFDYMVWYPLGRPVGSTIYPGMQFTAVFIKDYILPDWSINDVCCYLPAWFGSIATFITAMIAYECTLPENSTLNPYRIVLNLYKGVEVDDVDSKNNAIINNNKKTIALGITSPALECAIMTMAIMAIVPAHIMRSVGGGYDNESVAMTAMVSTFYFWIRSLRNSSSWYIGAIAGIAYFYMVASWGGYIFVLNMVGLHAAVLVLLGRFSTKVYLSYSLFYVIGTALAIQIPVVGRAPLKSLEQLGPCAVFLGYQGLQIVEVIRKKQRLSRKEAWKLRVKVALGGLAALVLLIVAVCPPGYFGPLSSRVRGLFVQHTKTGNPLVDSVAEHQPASNKAYFQYLHHVCLLAPIGYLVTAFNLSDASSFLLCWGSVTYFFSSKMVRLVLLLAPIGSVLGGIAAGRILSWACRQLWDASVSSEKDADTTSTTSTPSKIPQATPLVDNQGASSEDLNKGTKKNRSKVKKASTSKTGAGDSPLEVLQSAVQLALNSKEGIIVKRTAAVVILILTYMMGSSFKNYSWRLSADLSHPSIIVRARTRTGQVVTIDDYREAYWWLRDNTPEDARILAWWDYGYQITAIANRTTIADGNTWNHEHIALLGKCLTTSIEEGHEIARQLADYVLIWGGGGGDDLAKSPHLARIANSVYRDHCPLDDTTCRAFGFMDRQGTPSPMMARSLLYKLHGHALREGVVAPPHLFTETFRSKYGKVRIFKIENVDQESKKWCADPANRVCDAPGSWFCPGQYPPGLADILSRKSDFQQLEDFNRGAGGDQEYQRKYFEALNNPERATHDAIQQDAKRASNIPAGRIKTAIINEDGTVSGDVERAFKKPDAATIERIWNNWEDTETTTALWTLIHQNRVQELRDWLYNDPPKAYTRSADGRGPMWWAYEARNQEVVKMLQKIGIPDTDKDATGKTPVDLLNVGQ